MSINITEQFLPRVPDRSRSRIGLLPITAVILALIAVGVVMSRGPADAGPVSEAQSVLLGP